MKRLVAGMLVAAGLVAAGGCAPASQPAGSGEGAGEKPVTFLGVSSPGRKVVYLIDRSGSMTCPMDFAKYALKRSIEDLDARAEFHVIFWSSGPPAEMPPRRLVEATQANKRLAFEFIDGVITRGEADPSQALELAFACEPDVIYLLTDGGPDKETAALVRRLNADRKVAVQTIAFLHREGESVLMQIADENNGQHKFVSEWDLGKLMGHKGMKREEHGAAFFGLPPGAARKIVYVVDRSGSMMNSLDFVKYELKCSIDNLPPEVQFHVVFWSSGPPLEMPTRGLATATHSRRLAFEFIDGITAQGETDPSQALERAFACGPDLIYLLTDGQVDRAIVDLVKRNNPDGKVTVHTIGFLYRTGEAVLKQIAAENNGRYVYVSEGDLALLGR